MASDPSFGVLLPHFGPHCSVERLTETAVNAEALGFDHVWVRDLLYVPPSKRDHGGIDEGLILEPNLTLAALSSITDEITLGTAVVWPKLHPLNLSQQFGTLSYLSGGRVVCGIGAGAFREPFDALDLPFDERPQLVRETVEILRRTFEETDVDYHGELFEFENVTIDPRPVDDVPIWYGGVSFNSVRRAVDYCDGWFPGRITYDKFEDKMDLLGDLEAEHERSIDVGCIPIVSVAENSDDALDRIDMEGLVEDANTILEADYQSKADIDGYYVAGDPDECAEQIQRFVDLGADHVVLDMRQAFDDVEEMMDLAANDVKPRVE